MTVEEAARRLGVKRGTVEVWRSAHRRQDGRRALLEEAWDHYAAVKAGLRDGRRGMKPARHWVRGKKMTVKEAAEALGVKEGTLRAYLRYHGCSLDAACRFYRKRRENREKREAVKEILRIINGG